MKLSALVRTPRVLEPTKQAQARPHRAVLRREHLLQVLARAEGADDLDSARVAEAGADRGRAGTAALFHCNTLHVSGHNLAAEDRWHIYISFNACANAPAFAASSQPDGVVSRNTAPFPVEEDGGAILKLRTDTKPVFAQEEDPCSPPCAVT